MTHHPDDQARATRIVAGYAAVFGVSPEEAARHIAEMLADESTHDMDACPICSTPTQEIQ